MPASASAPHNAARTRLTTQAFGAADMANDLVNDLVNDLAEAKIRVAKAECTMAMSFGPVCGGSPSPMAYPVPRRRRPLSCGAIGLSGRRGEGHAVAVFCVEG